MVLPKSTNSTTLRDTPHMPSSRTPRRSLPAPNTVHTRCSPAAMINQFLSFRDLDLSSGQGITLNLGLPLSEPRGKKSETCAVEERHHVPELTSRAWYSWGALPPIPCCLQMYCEVAGPLVSCADAIMRNPTSQQGDCSFRLCRPLRL